MPEKIDPWSSQQLTKYEHVFKEFGLKEFPEEWSKHLDHYLFKRNLVIAHRDFEKIMKCIQEKKPFINITGIASSGRLHLGHKFDIDLFKFFKTKKAKNYFTIADIDAYVSRPNEKVPSLEKAKEFAVNNLAHVLALGLDEKDVYVQSKYTTRYYEFAFELSKRITRNEFEAVYGHVDLGKISAALLQYADILHPQLKEFEGKMPSITGIGLDQDPHARIARDLAQRVTYPMELPSFVYFKHQQGLREHGKMSSSDLENTIFLDDSEEDIKKKINKAFTGGRNTLEEQKKLGTNIEIDRVIELLRFHYPDEKKLNEIIELQKTGKQMSGELKQFAIEFLLDWRTKHLKLVEKNKKTAEKIVYGK
ncbi:MAG: tryptophan--tRNA ligase [Candidatus Diapherotrites archaeon]|nr:tryptophan--tRNA ligase [Candidatus Diapherotrites archaeon]